MSIRVWIVPFDVPSDVEFKLPTLISLTALVEMFERVKRDGNFSRHFGWCGIVETIKNAVHVLGRAYDDAFSEWKYIVKKFGIYFPTSIIFI